MLTVSTTGLFCSPGLRRTRLRLADLLRRARASARRAARPRASRSCATFGVPSAFLACWSDGDDADVLKQDVGDLRCAVAAGDGCA